MRGWFNRIKFVVISLVVIAALIYFCDAIKLTKPVTDMGVPVVEVALFEGGYGIDWYLKVARDYEQLMAQQGKAVKIDLWGSPRVLDKLRPRILKNSPPEITNTGFLEWKMIVAGEYVPLNVALDTPAWGQTEMNWRETFIPGALDLYTFEGNVYGVPLQFSAWVVWYDAKLFREHGWQVPKSWAELEQLCRQIKAAGIAPFAFQGKYPSFGWNTLVTILQRWGGMQVIEHLQNAGTEKGFFVSDDFITAARILQDFAREYFQPGAMSMTHTEAQMEWCNRRAAMVACGLWLENEMYANIPNDFEMSCFNIPVIDGGRGDPNKVCAGFGEMFFVYTDSVNKTEAMDFLKYMLSQENGKAFSSVTGTISAIKGTTDRDMISRALLSALEIMEQSNGTFNSERIRQLYPEWSHAITPALDNLLGQRWTPEKFGRFLEDEMQKIRDDEDIYKPPPVKYHTRIDNASSGRPKNI